MSWWLGLPEVRSEFEMSPVICMATPWLKLKSSILSLKSVRFDSPFTSDPISRIKTSIVPPLLLSDLRGVLGVGFWVLVRANTQNPTPRTHLRGGGLRQLGDQADRGRQLFELEMRPQGYGRA